MRSSSGSFAEVAQWVELLSLHGSAAYGGDIERRAPFVAVILADPEVVEGPGCDPGVRRFESARSSRAFVVQGKGAGLLSQEVAVRIRPKVPRVRAQTIR